MGFEYPGGRPRVVLSKDVRRIGSTMMGEMAAALMDLQGLKREDIQYWVLHSAGRYVIDRAVTVLGLGEDQVAATRQVLRQYGNMSSATILFVLEETLRTARPVPGEWGLMIGLGTGLRGGRGAPALVMRREEARAGATSTAPCPGEIATPRWPTSTGSAPGSAATR